jgi:hypothetical protein
MFYQTDKSQLSQPAGTEIRGPLFSNGMLWYRPEMLGSLMPMPVVSATMAVPRYFHILGLSTHKSAAPTPPPPPHAIDTVTLKPVTETYLNASLESHKNKGNA